jgi:putative tryptophan/tyrosine transport system substrate-binding protein
MNWNSEMLRQPPSRLTLFSCVFPSCRQPISSPRSNNEEKSDALYIFASGFAQGHWTRLAQLALDHRLPAIYAFREFADRGGLLSYGASNSDAYRRAAALVDKILKGLRPSDLPVEQPTRFEFVINARTAKALGLEVPPTLLALADEVIE